MLTFETMPDPEPQAGEVLVDLQAIGVNYVDVYHRTGQYPGPTAAHWQRWAEATGVDLPRTERPWRLTACQK